MGLTLFQPKTAEIAFSGGTLTVRGLCLEDMAILLRTYAEPLGKAFDAFMVSSGDIPGVAPDLAEKIKTGAVKAALIEAVDVAPGLVAAVIARAADLSPEEAPTARLIPTGAQLEAIEAIITLTLEAEGGLEKLIETVSRLARSLIGLTANRSR